MKSLSEYIHSKGLKAGICSNAGLIPVLLFWDKNTIEIEMGLNGHN